jgi:hypothetical protein
MDMDENPINQSYSARMLLHGAIQRFSAQSATCKLWAVILSSVVLLFSAGRTGGENLLWAATPVVLLAIVDAVYSARATALRRASLEFANKGEQELVNALFAFGDFREVARSFVGVAVMPFYLLLFGMVAGLGLGVVVPKAKTAVASSPTGTGIGTSGQVMPQMGVPFNMAPSAPNAPRSQFPSSDPAGNGVLPSRPITAPMQRFAPAAPAGAQVPPSTQGTPPSSLLLNRNVVPPPNVVAPRPPVLTPPGATSTGVR